MTWHDPFPSPPFPLPRGHVYGVDDGTIYTHSGYGRPSLRRRRDRGNIRNIQRRLNISVDGLFGPATGRAVGRFQRNQHLAADQAVGPATWSFLF